MGTSIAFVTVHILRAIASVLAMLVIGVVAWFSAGFLSVILDRQTVWFVTIGAIVVAVVAIGGGAIVSVRFITPRAVVHPVIAALVLAIAYVRLFTSGDIGVFAFAVPSVAVAIAAAAALVFRPGQPPPNKSLERTRDR